MQGIFLVFKKNLSNNQYVFELIGGSIDFSIKENNISV